MTTFQRLFQRYARITPSFRRLIEKHFEGRMPPIDHVAHRSIYPRPIVRFYQDMGHTLQEDVYGFPQLMTRAVWLKPPCPNGFRVFVSETIRKHEPPLIRTPQQFKELAQIDQYLAWVLIHGHAINHVALAVPDALIMYDLLSKDKDFRIANPLQISADGQLKQFSLRADRVRHRFPNGYEADVPGSFVELIERAPGREGFDADNAHTIFQSTR